MTSMEIVQDMKVGWNLGNTLDSIYWENNRHHNLKQLGVIRLQLNND